MVRGGKRQGGRRVNKAGARGWRQGREGRSGENGWNRADSFQMGNGIGICK